MKWTVDWVPSAEGDLADFWNKGPDRQEITAAADAIDVDLCRDPYAVGESREGNLRILFMPPLAIHYKVDQSANKVIVASVWRHPK